MIGCVASSAVLLIFAGSSPVLWVGTGFYGFAMSSSFPTAMSLCESYVKLSGSNVVLRSLNIQTGKLASVLVVGASFGGKELFPTEYLIFLERC
jgi:hypothetical protein